MTSVCSFTDVHFDHLDEGEATRLPCNKSTFTPFAINLYSKGRYLTISCSPTKFHPIDLASVDNSCLNNKYCDPYVFLKAESFRTGPQRVRRFLNGGATQNLCQEHLEMWVDLEVGCTSTLLGIPETVHQRKQRHEKEIYCPIIYWGPGKPQKGKQRNRR